MAPAAAAQGQRGELGQPRSSGIPCPHFLQALSNLVLHRGPQFLWEVDGTDWYPYLIDGETEVEQPSQGHTAAGSCGARPRAYSLYHTVTHSRPAGRAASSWDMSHTASQARELTVQNYFSQTIEGSRKGAPMCAFCEKKAAELTRPCHPICGSYLRLHVSLTQWPRQVG